MTQPAPDPILIRGARCALGPRESERCLLELTSGRIRRILRAGEHEEFGSANTFSLDLGGFLVLPGLINAHDHLEFSLFPRLAVPPYRNYIEWGVDIHSRFPDIIAAHRSVPIDVRVWWGGIRNLLCGVTTVSHHNPLHPAMLEAQFPVRVIREYGWAHSPALGGDLRSARASTPENAAFLIHACEGTDEVARNELWDLDRQGLLDANIVLIHGLALDQRGVDRMIERRTSLIVCPSSNHFLFGTLPNLGLLNSIPHVVLGNDSPLTAEGDLLDEIQFATGRCDLTPEAAWAMVTTSPARILRLHNGEGTLQPGGFADVVVVKDTGMSPADTLQDLSKCAVELVIIGGHVQLASQSLYQKLPFKLRAELEPLYIDGAVRWLRVPMSHLLQRAEQVLGAGQVQLGSCRLTVPEQEGVASHVS